MEIRGAKIGSNSETVAERHREEDMKESALNRMKISNWLGMGH